MFYVEILPRPILQAFRSKGFPKSQLRWLSPIECWFPACDALPQLPATLPTLATFSLTHYILRHQTMRYSGTGALCLSRQFQTLRLQVRAATQFTASHCGCRQPQIWLKNIAAHLRCHGFYIFAPLCLRLWLPASGCWSNFPNSCRELFLLRLNVLWDTGHSLSRNVCSSDPYGSISSGLRSIF